MINRDVFYAYDEELEKVATLIREDLPDPGGGTLDGREWCEEHNIPESAFADAVNRMGDADYGVSPMHPWKLM